MTGQMCKKHREEYWSDYSFIENHMAMQKKEPPDVPSDDPKMNDQDQK